MQAQQYGGPKQNQEVGNRKYFYLRLLFSLPNKLSDHLSLSCPDGLLFYQGHPRLDYQPGKVDNCPRTSRAPKTPVLLCVSCFVLI